MKRINCQLLFLLALYFSTVSLYSQNNKEFDNEDLKFQIEKNFNAFSSFFYDSEISTLFYLRPESLELELIGSVCPVNKTNSQLQKKVEKLGGSSYSVTLEDSVHSIKALKALLEEEINYNSILSIHHSGETFLVKKYLIE